MSVAETKTASMVRSTSFPLPQRGASLMLAFRMHSRTILIIGAARLAASRAFSALEADSKVVLLVEGGLQNACEELRWRAQQGDLEVLDLADFGKQEEHVLDRHAAAIDNFLEQSSVSLVCVTDALLCGSDPRRSRASASAIYNVCRSRNIPVNVTDMPSLCDFTFCATHRFTRSSVSDGGEKSGKSTPLQIALTTNGEGCRLAGRLKRELVSCMPKDVGEAVERLGTLRRLARSKHSTQAVTVSAADGQEGQHAEGVVDDEDEAEAELSDEILAPSPNRTVKQRSKGKGGCYNESEDERSRRRMKWVAQISEFWPIDRLAALTDAQMEELLTDNSGLPSTRSSPSPFPDYPMNLANSQHGLFAPTTSKGRIYLVGSGLGHPSLLTLAAHRILTREAQLVLTDKLVPSGVLDIIPSGVEVRVARKFPGNAEGAQQEMMEAALEAANMGRTVVRLKQGDPMLYGRAGEEILFLRAHGFEATVIPGISSALAAPLFANIPVTQRGVAESLTICTGVGRGGKGVRLPGYERARTLVVLMGIARLEAVVHALLSESSEGNGGREGRAYPPYLPMAIVERASMPDQRVVTSTLRNVVEALESTGEQRPPGLLIIGWAVLTLCGSGQVDVLDENEESGEVQQAGCYRIEKWLGTEKWRVKEGLDEPWLE